MSQQQVVLITGASSGIGQATARLLAQKSFTVYGTSRNSSADEQMRGVEILPLDVGSDVSVKACTQAVLTRAGHLGILINNAGYQLEGAIEEVSIEEAKAQFETNFFGVMRMIRAALPIMRQQGGGQIINISSLGGLVPGPPFLGVYSASKFALEAYTENLWREVKPFNIRVSLVEPGNINSNLARNRQSAAERINDYDSWRQHALEALRQLDEKAPEPTLVADCVLRIIESKSPKLRYGVGLDGIWIPRLRRFLPELAFEQVVRSIFNLDANK